MDDNEIAARVCELFAKRLQEQLQESGLFDFMNEEAQKALAWAFDQAQIERGRVIDNLTPRLKALNLQPQVVHYRAGGRR